MPHNEEGCGICGNTHWRSPRSSKTFHTQNLSRTKQSSTPSSVFYIIVGEAANHVSKGFQEKHPEIEWAQIIGLRNILAHEYGEVKMDKIYLAATKAVPALLKYLEPLISEE
jgi:uncharacterized protein with HEPN domain